MKTKPCLSVLAIAAFAGFSLSIARAAEDPPAVELVKMMNLGATGKSAALATFEPVIKKMQAQGLPAEAIAEVREAADRFFDQTLNDPQMNVEVAKIYQNNFTAAEIEQLLAFYKTPLGRKTLETLPKVMTESSQVGQKLAVKHQAEFQKEMQGIMAKYAGKKSESEE
jgi:hypothetical protein